MLDVYINIVNVVVVIWKEFRGGGIILVVSLPTCLGACLEVAPIIPFLLEIISRLLVLVQYCTVVKLHLDLSFPHCL